MTNSIKHTVYKTLTTALLAAAWIGCGPGQNNGTTSQAPQCKDVTVEEQDYCVIKQDIIIETGYTCPSRFAYTYEVSELVVCSNQSMIPTMPIIFEIWRLAYDMAPPDADMGGDMPTGDMARSCDDIETDYANVFDNVPTSCQQDTDCEGVPWHCGLASKTSGDICTASMSAGTDVSMLETLRDEYQQSGCSIPQCAACPAATYTCEQGTCVGRIAGERTCDDVKADYATTYAAFSTSCQVAADCEYAGVNTCGIARQVVGGCGLARATGQDTSQLMTLGQEYDSLGCGMNDPACDACPETAVDCVANECVVVSEQPRTCDDVKADYAAAYAAFSTSCQVAADCEYAGVNTCGIARQVVGGCGLARATGQDTSQLMTLGQEYDSLGCGMNDPVCDACPGAAVDCVDNVCVAMEM